MLIICSYSCVVFPHNIPTKINPLVRARPLLPNASFTLLKDGNLVHPLKACPEITVAQTEFSPPLTEKGPIQLTRKFKSAHTKLTRRPYYYHYLTPSRRAITLYEKEVPQLQHARGNKRLVHAFLAHLRQWPSKTK